MQLQEALRKKEAAEEAAILETYRQTHIHLADLIANLARRAGSFLFGTPPLKINLRMSRAPEGLTSAMANFPRAFRHYRPRSQKVFGVIIVSSSKRSLIVQGRTSGIWSFPKGHITGSETSQECAMRETLEETGIDMTHHKPFMVKKLYAGEYFF